MLEGVLGGPPGSLSESQSRAGYHVMEPEIALNKERGRDSGLEQAQQ